MLQDIRHAVRHLVRSPGCAIAGLVILSLGIGTNSAMFSVMNALVLRPLPIKDPHSLIGVSGRNTQQQLRLTPIPAVDVLAQADSPLDGEYGEMRAQWEVASPSFFETLGIPLLSLSGRVTTWADNDRSP